MKAKTDPMIEAMQIAVILSRFAFSSSEIVDKKDIITIINKMILNAMIIPVPRQ